MTCYLIRHGKDDDTVRGGWSLSSLTDEGRIQVESLTEHITRNQNELKIEKLFSSDLPRAMQTAQPIATALNLEVKAMPEFRETNNGILAGMPNAIADEKYPGVYWSALGWEESYPQGESPRVFYERIKAAWKQFSEMILVDNQNVVLVTHGGVINVICSLINGRDYSNKDKAEYIPHAVMIPLVYSQSVWHR